MNQIKEAARQILGQVSDIQAVTSLCGLGDVNLKLADIREKAAFLLEDHGTPEQILCGYNHDATAALAMFGEELVGRKLVCDTVDDVDLGQLVRMAEIFVRRTHVYFDRKTRAMMEESDVG